MFAAHARRLLTYAVCDLTNCCASSKNCRQMHRSFKSCSSCCAEIENSALARSTRKSRLVVLGSGWAASSLVKHIDLSQYALTVVSRVNHMVFTPMLPSAAVGSVDERSTAISIFGIQSKLKDLPNRFLTGEAVAVDPEAKRVTCRDDLGGQYALEYDILVVATGSQGSTFGTPGVEKNALFLRDVRNASDIRQALIRNWQLARSPGQSEEEKRRLLRTVIVGGGPTGVEFAGELCDLLQSDLRQIDGHRASQSKITIVEAQALLGNFDTVLRDYAVKNLIKRGVEIIEKGIVKEVKQTEAVLSDGRTIPFGLCVWSTGVGPTAFTTALPFAKTARGRIAVDKYLRVSAEPAELCDTQPHAVEDPRRAGQVNVSMEEHHKIQQERVETLVPLENTFALGDCCANIGTPLPSLAQVAEQQGRYLAQCLSSRHRETPPRNPFVWRQLGSMASIGSRNAIIELGEHTGRHINWKGWTSYLAWKSAYLSKLYTMRSRLRIFGNWCSTAIFGRDVSRW